MIYTTIEKIKKEYLLNNWNLRKLEDTLNCKISYDTFKKIPGERAYGKAVYLSNEWKIKNPDNFSII
jgi:hypothetical protein